MWKTFTVANNTYMLNVLESNEKYKIYLSDLADIWCDEFTREEIVNIFQECNPTIEIKLDEVVAQVLKIFDEINEAEVTITKLEDKIDMYIKFDILGLDNIKFKVKYSLNLTTSDNKKFADEITIPMIHTINCLEKQQKMLCDLILKKDRELEEYKMEKGLISRTDLTTEKFDPNVMEKSSEKLLLNVYNDSSKFWESFVGQHGNVDTKIAEVTVDPWNQVKRKRKIYNAKTSAKKSTQTILKPKCDKDLLHGILKTT